MVYNKQKSASLVPFGTCGEAILRWRTEKGWTQAELGDQIGVTGAYITQVETGVRIPSDNACVLLHEVLQMPQQEWDTFFSMVYQARDRVRGQRRERRRELMTQAQMRLSERSPASRPDADLPETSDGDPQARQAMEQLRLILNSPLREATLAALEAWAERVNRRGKS